MKGGCLSRIAPALLLLVGAYAVGLLIGPPVLTATRTTLLLAEMVELPVRPLSLVSTSPRRLTMTYGEPADRLDVYFPAEATSTDRRPAVILALGVHPQPIDSPDMVRIASAIARVGVIVGVPDSTALRELRLEPDEPAHLADALLSIAALPEVDPSRVALAGFSAGASIALVAATDPRISSDLEYVSAFGGYADAATLLADVASRTMLVGHETVPWAADEGIERDLRELVHHSVGESVVHQLFESESRAQAEAVIEDLSAEDRSLLSAVSPLDHAQAIEAPIYLLHGAPDSAIPISHAGLLAEALGDRVVRLTVFGRFGHGQPGDAGLGLEDAPDLWSLLLHLHDIVAATTE